MENKTIRRSTRKLPTLSRGELLRRLQEAEDTIDAIRSGEVDAIVVNGPHGEKVFTLEGADHTYRVFVERMNEGAAVLSGAHTVLHCNRRFAGMLGLKLQNVIGSAMQDLALPADRAALDSLLRRAAQKNCWGEIHLQSQNGGVVPVRLALNSLWQENTQVLCMIASDLSNVKRVERELRASSEQLRNLAVRLLSVREEDQTRIAREIHDELGQSLTAVKIDLAWLAGRLRPENIPMRERIDSALELVDGIIQSVRRISTELRPAILDLGLAGALEWQMQEFQARTGIQCELRLLTQTRFAPDVSTALFRIFQETLTNVARHANATRVEVVNRHQGDRLVLRIRDNGRGFDPASPSLSVSLGLLGMRERAAMLGGEVSISSAPGKGTRVTAWVPIRPEASVPTRAKPGARASTRANMKPSVKLSARSGSKA